MARRAEPSMTPAEMKRAIGRLGWTVAQVSANARVSREVAQKWAEGTAASIPPTAAAYFELVGEVVLLEERMESLITEMTGKFMGRRRKWN